MIMTAGTKTPETLSAIFAIGALVAAASDTIFMICDKVVSSPTLLAVHFIKPEVLIVAAETLSPSALSTGILSPVSADSSTALTPSTTTPSTGMLSPGRTTNVSPIRTVSMGTCSSVPSLTTVAILGESFIRLFSASVVFPLERASSILPTVIKVRIIAADSKYSSSIYCIARALSPAQTAALIANRETTLYPKAAVAPSATRVSILGALFIRLLNPLIKNFWLITMIAMVSSICKSPTAT